MATLREIKNMYGNLTMLQYFLIIVVCVMALIIGAELSDRININNKKYRVYLKLGILVSAIISFILIISGAIFLNMKISIIGMILYSFAYGSNKELN